MTHTIALRFVRECKFIFSLRMIARQYFVRNCKVIIVLVLVALVYQGIRLKRIDNVFKYHAESEDDAGSR